MRIREPFDWLRAAIVVVLALALVGGLKVAEFARHIWRRATR